MVQTSGDPVPTVTEHDATGTVKAIYQDIKSVLGVPVVNLIFRHIATMPGALEWVWAMVRPLYAGDKLTKMADQLMADIAIPTLPRLTRPALQAVGVDTAGERTIARILKAYNRSNPMNLMALTTLLVYLEDNVGGKTLSDTATDPLALHQDTPPVPEALPPLLSLAEMDQATAALVRSLNALSPQGEARTMPSMYRHLAHWPGYLALALTLLQPLHVNGSLQTAIEHAAGKAAALARDLVTALRTDVTPPAPIGNVQHELASALRYFSANLIVEMLPVGKWLYAALAGSGSVRL